MYDLSSDVRGHVQSGYDRIHRPASVPGGRSSGSGILCPSPCCRRGRSGLRAVLVASLAVFAALALYALPLAAANGVLPAFPGAEGFGASAKGGRGGSVIYVTNLNDSGSGSLRACVDASGPRTCIFRVGGTINLRSTLDVKNPFLTIAGQTAPGGGVAIRTEGSVKGPAVRVSTHDVIIRYIRVRPGPSIEKTCCRDGIEFLNGANNVIVDHVSVSWSVDEVISTWYGARNITIQWSILSEALGNAGHEKGYHSMGPLFGSDGAGNISFHHNVLAHNNERNPRVVMNFGVFDMVNNVIYNWGRFGGTAMNNTYGSFSSNIIGNYYKPGPHTPSPSSTREYFEVAVGGGLPLYAEGNIGPRRANDTLNQYANVQGTFTTAPNPFFAPPITITSAASAYEQVLARAGATQPMRDAVDNRIINDIKNSTGRIIDDPANVGGWPVLSSGRPYVDADGDGMPDWWEIEHGLDPDDPDDRNGDLDNDGYTNLEEFLNGTSPTPLTCHLLDSSKDVPVGHGAAYDVFSSGRGVLISITCDWLPSATVEVGNGQKNLLIYKTGYEWTGSRWKAFDFEGLEPLGDWFVGYATKTLFKTQQELEKRNYIAVYMCQSISGSWKCACRDSNCAQPLWSLQAYQIGRQ